MRKIFISLLAFSFCITCAKITFSAPVPIVPQWQYYSTNNTDCRSFIGETMSVAVSGQDTLFGTWPSATYPADQDFNISVAFNNFSTQGNAVANSNSSSIDMELKWELDNGHTSHIWISRKKYWDGSGHIATGYSEFGENYDHEYGSSSENDSHTSGILSISKTDNSVTVTAKDANGDVIHSKTFSSITTFESDLSIHLNTSNGTWTSTSAQFSNFNMDPVPVNVNNVLLRNVNDEGESQKNSIVFSVRDSSGNVIKDSVVSSFQFFDPAGTSIPFDSSRFEGSYRVLYGNYDPLNGRWNYENNFQEDGYYKGIFSGNISAGDYHLVVNVNGLTYHRYLHFNGMTSLPSLSSDSIYAYKDEAGNLYFSWDVPRDYITANINTTSRAWVDVYDAGALKAEVWVNIPTHLGHIFIPNQVVQLYEAEGNDYRVGVQLRTRDNQNRSNTKSIPLIIAQGGPVKGDINKDGKVGLEEAISALKITAGK